MIWPDIAFASFYALDFLYDALVRFKEKNAAIQRLLEEVETEFKAYAIWLAEAIFDYFALISFGEARHAKKWLNKGWRFDCFPEKCSREMAYKIAKQFDPWQFLPKLLEVFAGEWTMGFGGGAWYDIVETALQKKRLDPIVFVDRGIQLEHYNGRCFDKCVIFWDCGSLLDEMLKDINDLPVKDWLADWPVSRLAKRLLMKAKRLGVIDIPEITAAYAEGYYEPVEWGEGCPDLVWEGGEEYE